MGLGGVVGGDFDGEFEIGIGMELDASGGFAGPVPGSGQVPSAGSGLTGELVEGGGESDGGSGGIGIAEPGIEDGKVGQVEGGDDGRGFSIGPGGGAVGAGWISMGTTLDAIDVAGVGWGKEMQVGGGAEGEGPIGFAGRWMFAVETEGERECAFRESKTDLLQ